MVFPLLPRSFCACAGFGRIMILMSTLVAGQQEWCRGREEGLNDLRKTLKHHRYASVDGETMKQWLDADLLARRSSVKETSPAFEKLWAEAPPQHSPYGDTIYYHKKVFHSTYDFQASFDNRSGLPARRTHGIVTDKEGVRRQRYDVHKKTDTDGEATSHYVRYYPALPDKWDHDPLVRSVHRLFVDVFAEQHQQWMGVRPPFGNVMFQFCYRTVMSKQNGTWKGDPGPEGAHVDGGTAAMVLVVRRDNIKPRTGGTRIWSMKQHTGKSAPEDVESDRLLHTWKPSGQFDALFFLDESVLHEALKGELMDPSSEAHRDMLILDVRRPDSSWQGVLPVQKGKYGVL